jgi:alcohol dehydrogenase, propanol-preferring
MTGAFMKAMVLAAARTPLVLTDRPVPVPGRGDLLLRVEACGVCRTDLHVLDGELPEPALPLVLGHEIVGRVVGTGPDVAGVHEGDRVGVPWLGGTCGACSFCASGRENLCDRALFTGYQRDGGYAGFAAADARFCFPIPEGYSSVDAAPFLCAGLIGFRSLRMAGDARRLGIYGFGGAAHLVAQVAVAEGRRLYAFTRPGDLPAQEFARSLGCAWAGGSDERPPEELDAAILFAPVGALVPLALRAVAKGGAVVCGGIHMSDIPAFPYELLWGERSLRSVANLTRRDGTELFETLAHLKVRSETKPYPLERANEALDDLRHGRFQGAAVLVP